jgi:hypothetical protein
MKLVRLGKLLKELHALLLRDPVKDIVVCLRVQILKVQGKLQLWPPKNLLK